MLAGDLAQILVYIGRVDGVSVALSVEVLKQLLPRDVRTALDDLRQSPVAQIDGVMDAAFSLEGKHNLRAVNLHVAVAESG